MPHERTSGIRIDEASKLAHILGCIRKACCISYGRSQVVVSMFNSHDRRPVGCTQKKDSDISITYSMVMAPSKQEVPSRNTARYEWACASTPDIVPLLRSG